MKWMSLRFPVLVVQDKCSFLSEWNKLFAMVASLLIGVSACVVLIQLTAQTSQAGPVAPGSMSVPHGTLDDCGEPTFVENLTATYTIAKWNCVYGTDTLSITKVTDMRDGDQYADKVDYEMRALTVYRAYDDDTPLDGQNDRPVIFFVHGGGWTNGYRPWSEFVARSFTGEMGWVTVVIDYRLTSDDVFLADKYCETREKCETNVISRTKAAWYPDNIKDVAAAFEWTVDNISSLGGNPGQIFIFGHSAGGHLASLLATHSDYETKRSDMKGVISMSGAYSLTNLYKPIWNSAISQTFKGGFNNTVMLNDASPVTCILSDTVLPPFYVLYAQYDLPSLTNQNIAFVNLLESHDLSVAHNRLEGYGHVNEMTAIEYITETPTALIVDFITDILYPNKVYLPLILK